MRTLVRGSIHQRAICCYTKLSAGQDATEAFFSLHRHEVLQRPQFARLQIGVIAGEKQQIHPRAAGALSKVPYAEPTWLTPGFHSPYYKDVCSYLAPHTLPY